MDSISSTTHYYAQTGDTNTGRSPVPYLLKCNKPPIASDTSAIRSAISQAETDLSSLDHQISQAAAVLGDLQGKRTQDEQYLNNLKGIIHPIRRTPPELLSAIFIHALPRAWQLVISTWESCNDYRRAVLLPGQVCGVWRDISLTTPQLWSKISFEIGCEGKNFQAEVDLVDTWLRRTGKCPLYVEIFQREKFNSRPVVPDALIESCSRWRFLQLSGSSTWLHSGVLNGVRNRLSSLQILFDDQRRASLSQAGPDYGRVDLLEHASQLRHYRFRRGTTLPPFNIHWVQLSELSMEQISFQQFYEILSEAQNLVKCSISGVEWKNRDLSFPPLRHTHLRSLSIEQNQHSFPLLDYLTLPSLSKLQYTDTTAYYGFDIFRSALVTALSRSMCSLQWLTLGFADTVTGDDYVLQILRLMPSLLELQLTQGAPDELLRGLTLHTSDSESVAPRLHTFTLTGRGQGTPHPFISSCLMDMIESRWNVGHAAGEAEQAQVRHLKHVRISLRTHKTWTYGSGVRTRLWKLRDEGLDICFLDNNGMVVRMRR